MRHSIIVFLATVSLSVAQTKGTVLIVTNPGEISRPAETIVLDLDGLYYRQPELRTKPFSIFDKKREIGYQLIDENSDGANDHLVFQTSFKPLEKKEFRIRITGTSPTAPVPATDARFVLPREDFAWENDRVAFRMYGPALSAEVNNGIDVWTKRVRYPIVAKWYHESAGSQPGKDSYHVDKGEGADFFSVGRTLGAGSTGIVYESALIQPGVFSHYKIIASGPIRMIAELYYDGWKIGGKKFLQIKRITLDAGEQLNIIQDRFVSISSFDSLTVAGGLVKRANTVLQQNGSSRWISLWGLTTADSVNGYLGTAVIFPQQYSVSFGEDSLQYFVSATIDAGMPFEYFAGFAWSRMGDIRSGQEWTRYLNDFVQRKHYPLSITLINK